MLAEKPKYVPMLMAALTLACANADTSDHATVLDSAVWTTETAWKVSAEPVLEIRGSAQQIANVPVDPVSVNRLSDGRYVVGDGNQNGWNAILVYDSSGKFLQQLGRSGEGPGEFGQLLFWSGEYRGDSIAAFDKVGDELQIFAKDGKFGRTSKLKTGNFYGVLANGNVIQAARNPDADGRASPTINLYGPDATQIREMYKIPPSRRQPVTGPNAPPYFGPRPIYHVGRAHWYRGESDQFRIEVYDTLGKMVRVLDRAIKPDPLTDDDREQITQVLVKAASGGVEGGTEIGKRYEQLIRTKADWPEFRPAFGTIIEDANGNVWVEHYRFIYPNFHPLKPKPTTWSVFDRNALFLGEVVMPASFMVSSITHDQVLGFWVDEFDVQHVRAYRLIKLRRE